MVFKTFTPNRKRFVRRRRQKRMPLSKRQAFAVKKLALSTVRKGQEIKRCFKKVNEEDVSPQLATHFLDSIQDMDTGSVGENFTELSVAGNVKQRWGTEVQPLALNIKGFIKINGTTDVQDRRETFVRLLLVERNENTPAIASSDQLLLVGNETSAVAGDVNDIFAPINWKYVKPVYDRTFKLCPALYNDNDPMNATQRVNGTRDFATFKIRHYFGKNAKPMKWSYNAESGNAYANSKNYQMLIMTRNMNDDTAITSNTLEVSCTSIFSYYDS